MDQKVAEFGRLLPQYEYLMRINPVRQIAEYKNERIRVTKKFEDLELLDNFEVNILADPCDILTSIMMLQSNLN